MSEKIKGFSEIIENARHLALSDQAENYKNSMEEDIEIAYQQELSEIIQVEAYSVAKKLADLKLPHEILAVDSAVDKKASTYAKNIWNSSGPNLQGVAKIQPRRDKRIAKRYEKKVSQNLFPVWDTKSFYLESIAGDYPNEISNNLFLGTEGGLYSGTRTSAIINDCEVVVVDNINIKSKNPKTLEEIRHGLGRLVVEQGLSL